LNRKISVLICVRNAEKYISACIKSILSQTTSSFELIIVDDLSTDNTAEIIKKFGDPRIKYYRNETWLGISKSRNRCIDASSGDFLFFTDADCVVSKDWIEQGLRCLDKPDCLGVEGRIYYVNEGYLPSFSDYVMENKSGNNFMTGNIAYKKSAVTKVGCFNEALTYLEDRDLAFRVMKLGKIVFNGDMVVYHPRVTLTPKKLLLTATIPKNRVYLFKRFGDRKFMLGRILFPLNLIKIFCPLCIFGPLLCRRFNDAYDYRLLPFFYIYVISERLQIWEESIKEHVFII
jgi:glycosyltransferase involved in cell wall biosynthesis